MGWTMIRVLGSCGVARADFTLSTADSEVEGATQTTRTPCGGDWEMTSEDKHRGGATSLGSG
jgi:hypothetical protein